MTDARQKELLQVAEGWSGLGVILSPLPYVGEPISDFCHLRAGKYYQQAYGAALTDETLIRITTLVEQFMEPRS